MSDNNTQQKDQQLPVRIKREDLPAYCPTEAMGLWSSHPRVYIPLDEKPEASCPYCGTQFVVVDK